jgi:ABC-type dipeptide/oligopeptide/nickel transport system ATPase subunit
LDDWSDRDLAGLLNDRRENVTEAEHLRNHISERIDNLQSAFRDLERPLESLIKDLEHEIPEDDKPLTSEREHLVEFSEQLAETRNELTSGDLLDIPHIEVDSTELEASLIPADINETLNHLQGITERVEEPDNQMAAYRTLAVATERYEKYKQTAETLDEKERLHKIAETVFTEFQSVRQQLMDDTLSEIYNEFVSLLDTFSSELMVDPDDGTFQSTDAGVEFRVPFHDGETHRPNLLFSEGQQDIIGLALFLSMTRAVTPELVDLVLLDDVLSSVDADHRANVARILNSEYGDEFQFLFTTHDLVWSRHLRRSDHIDSEENVVHLSSWSYHAGVHQHIDITQPRENIEYHLKNNDLTAAAAWARKMSEYYVARGCENFNVEVRFDKIRNLSLSDYLNSLMPVLSDRLREGGTDDETALNDGEVDDLLDTIGNMQTFIDQNLWGMNKNVHYSEPEAASFTKGELQSNIEAFEKIFEVIHCDDCESWRSESDTGIECDCSILLKT